MTVTLDGKSLTISSLDDGNEAVESMKDKWVDEELRRAIHIFGAPQAWMVKCYERDVAWADSTAKHLTEVIGLGNSVVFRVDEDDLKICVYILGLELTLDAAHSGRFHVLQIGLLESHIPARGIFDPKIFDPAIFDKEVKC